jgi:hypothetical protein
MLCATMILVFLFATASYGHGDLEFPSVGVYIGQPYREHAANCIKKPTNEIAYSFYRNYALYLLLEDQLIQHYNISLEHGDILYVLIQNEKV